MIVEQYLPAFHDGDAVGNSTLTLHRFLQRKGVDSRIVALTIDEELQSQAQLFSGYRPASGAIKILHFAIPSPLTDFFLHAPSRKVLVYHNVTPARFFIDFSSELVRITTAGRQQLGSLSDCFDLVVADSRFNAGELQALGFKDVRVFPIMIDRRQYGGGHSQPFFDLLKDERRNLIFVGRVTPNKKIEDLIRVLFFYKKYISPSIRLIVCGNTRTLPGYFIALKDMALRFLLTAEDIVFTGHLPLAEFLAVYRLADLFVSMSEHEGFCLPLIESCHFQVPVLAFDAGAVAETLDGAGLLFRDKKCERVAGLAERLLEDAALRKKLQALERKRTQRFKRESDPALFLEMLRRL